MKPLKITMVKTWRFLEQGGHLGWGHRAENRWIGAPAEDGVKPHESSLSKWSQTFDTVSAGDHWDRRMSRQMAPLLQINHIINSIYYIKPIAKGTC